MEENTGLQQSLQRASEIRQMVDDIRDAARNELSPYLEELLRRVEVALDADEADQTANQSATVIQLHRKKAV